MRILLMLLLLVFSGCCSFTAAPEHPNEMPGILMQVHEDSYPLFTWFDSRKAKYETDENGIPIANLPKVGKVEHATTVSQQGLIQFNLWIIERDPAHFEMLKKWADWLVQKQEPETGLWRFHWQNPWWEEGSPGWYSAMTQTQASSFLLRMWKYTDDQSYRDAADLAIKPFFSFIGQDGVTSRFPNGDIYFEHVCEPVPDAEPNHIWNAFCYAVLGLWEHHKYTESDLASSVWEEGWKSARDNAELFDNGNWILYSLRDCHMSNWRYHVVQVYQMQWFHKVTGDPKFKHLAEKWEAYFQDE